MACGVRYMSLNNRAVVTSM